MTPRQKKQSDPFEQTIEAALSPGNFISYAAASLFVDNVQDVASDIEKVIATEPERAALLFETFIAACHEKSALNADWQAVIADMRQRHFRKKGFMAGFEGILFPAHPSMLNRHFWNRQKLVG